MKVKRVEHVAIAVKDIKAAMEVFQQKLGLVLEYEEDFPQYQTKIAMYPVGETYLELLQATGDESETARWIGEKGEGLYHICLEVDDIEGALAELRGKGIRLIDERPRTGHGQARIAFLDPASTAHVLVELAQLPARGDAHDAAPPRRPEGSGSGDGIRPGLRALGQAIVTEAMVTRHAGNAQGGVLTTPSMIGLMEDTAQEATRPYLRADQTTVGFEVNVRHLAPTPLGAEITVAAELIAVDGRKLLFNVSARNERREIGGGTHRRTIVGLNSLRALRRGGCPRGRQRPRF